MMTAISEYDAITSTSDVILRSRSDVTPGPSCEDAQRTYDDINDAMSHGFASSSYDDVNSKEFRRTDLNELIVGMFISSV